jgi:hypothetical protein
MPDTDDAFSEFLAEQPGVWPEPPAAPDPTDSFNEFTTEGEPDRWLMVARGQPPVPILHHSPHVLAIMAVFVSLFTPAGLISTTIVSRNLTVLPMQVSADNFPPLPPSLFEASVGLTVRLPSSERLPSLPAPQIESQASSPTPPSVRPSEPVASPPPSARDQTALLPLTTAILPSTPAVVETLSAPPVAVTSLPAPPPKPAPEPERTLAAGPSVPDDDAQIAAVRATLDRYRNAFNQLDATEAKSIWPSLDEKTLHRAFNQLESQSIVFSKCDVDVSETKAMASCAGRVQFVPKVGSRTPRYENRNWNFSLRRERYWTIVSVLMR